MKEARESAWSSCERIKRGGVGGNTSLGGSARMKEKEEETGGKLNLVQDVTAPGRVARCLALQNHDMTPSYNTYYTP